MISGTILVQWRQTVLQKQIDYGVKLGQVVLSLAKMELDNFYKNVIPVSEYFDQSGLLSVVNGERNPAEVYKDFRDAVFEILGSQDNQTALLNGIAGIGRGANEIPGSIVTVETAPNDESMRNDVEAETSEAVEPATDEPESPIVDALHLLERPPTTNNNIDLSNLPPVIWVIGGPGSNKSTLCLKAVALNPGWSHFRYCSDLHTYWPSDWNDFCLLFYSIGRVVRAIAESDPKANTENHKIKSAIVAGEMIKRQSIDRIIETHLVHLADKKGIIIDGYPRDLKQVMDFEAKV